jgi:hypothetical protein
MKKTYKGWQNIITVIVKEDVSVPVFNMLLEDCINELMCSGRCCEGDSRFMVLMNQTKVDHAFDLMSEINYIIQSHKSDVSENVCTRYQVAMI